MKRDHKWWNELDYKESIDYLLALQLKKHGFDPLEAIVWFYNKKTKTIIFQSNYHYYLLKKNKLIEITEDDVWKKRSN